MEHVTINLTCPTSWQELSDRQLRFAFRQIAENATSVEVRTLCLFRWNKIRVLYASPDGKEYFVKKDKQTFKLDSEQIVSAIGHLKWMDELALFPVRISCVGGKKALPADFLEVPFNTFLYIDNLYQGYLRTQNRDILKEMLSMLYDSDKIRASQAELISVFYWFASLKQYFASMFPHFLQHDSNSASDAGVGSLSGDIGKRLQESMNAQIRALTKGDITKEKEVLAMDTWRALFELDAQAKEYQEMKKTK